MNIFRLWLAVTVLLPGIVAAVNADAQGVDAIAIRMDDRSLPEGSTSLPAAIQQAAAAALGVASTMGERTRDGAFTLKLSTPLPVDAARAALNRIRLTPGVLYANAAPGAPVPATTGRPTDRLIVKYRDARAASPTQSGVPLAAMRLDRVSALAGVPVAWVRAGHDGYDVLRMLQRLPIAQVEAIAARIEQDADVEYAQPDYIRNRQVVPTDPCYASASVGACSGGYQWDLFDPVGGINMPAAWNITTGSATINVAVIDTGALLDHPDLAGRFVGGHDMIADCAVANDGQPMPCTWSAQAPAYTSRDGDAADPGDWVSGTEDAGLGNSGPPYDWFQDCGADDSSWHGTHVAGTIGAVPNNGIGIVGINWVSRIVPLRVLGKCGGYTSDIAAAMVWAAGGNVPGAPANANPARVLSLSLGGSGTCDPASQSAINTALGLGAVVVVAAGNENQNASIHSPASCSGVITVAATTKTGRRARYSNYGAKVAIAAPGGNADGIDPDILSTLNSGATSPDPTGYIYARYAGTSMATPHVSGVASLMLSVNPALTPAQVLAKIQSTARAFPAPGPACNAIPQASACNCTTALCGAGILDAGAAVASAAGGNTVLTSSANPGSAGAAITFTAAVTGNAPTGTVKFDDGGTTLAGCAAVPLVGTGDVRTAACTTGTLAVGSHMIAASYSGDANNIASSGTLAQDVFNATTTLLASSGNPSFAGTSVTYTATVTGIAPTGTIKFDDGGAAIAGCATVALSGSGNTRTAACPAGTPTAGSHAIAVTYSGDSGNGSSGATLTQIVAPPVPGTATIVSNPYGPLTVQGATLSGNTISNMSDHVVIQFGNIAGSPPMAAQIDFQGLNLGPGRNLDIRSGAAGQFVFLVDKGSAPSVIAGELVANDFGGGFPVPYFKNRNGVMITATGLVSAQGGVGIDTLGAMWTVGQPLVNDGVIDAGAGLELVAAKVSGSGGFRGDNITIRTFGNANNPVNGAFFLSNGLWLQSGHGTGPATSLQLTIDAYGSMPQVLNFRSLSNARVWMPSSWPAGSTVPANNAVVPPNGVRPAGVPDPGYGGGSMIVQSDQAISLVNGGTNDFVFPGGIVLKAAGDLDFNGVAINQGWTTSGQSFQGLFFESPNIISTNGDIRVYSNDLNWTNFSTFPHAPVRSFTLARNGDGSASFAPADAIAPHLNTYSILVDAAANGACWVCLFNTQPVDMHEP